MSKLSLPLTKNNAVEAYGEWCRGDEAGLAPEPI
jgi:hypothetical protein